MTRLLVCMSVYGHGLEKTSRAVNILKHLLSTFASQVTETGKCVPYRVNE